MLIKFIQAIMIVTVFYAGLSYADDFEDGILAYNRYEDQRAIELFQKSCDSGKTEACYKLGVIYARGLGAKQDNNKALDFFERVCDKNHSEGCYWLGLRYLNQHFPSLNTPYDFGVKKDNFKAVKFFEKACTLESMTACRRLGVMYFNGDGSEKNKEKGLALMLRACDKNNTWACKNYEYFKDK